MAVQPLGLDLQKIGTNIALLIYKNNSLIAQHPVDLVECVETVLTTLLKPNPREVTEAIDYSEGPADSSAATNLSVDGEPTIYSAKNAPTGVEIWGTTITVNGNYQSRQLDG